ncbi:MAG: patatin-like phospholipase family protein [Acidobacteria bacterium]|nr:patatin-like phospholipase family protein [Acidobacteriota bacterium]
MKSYKRTLFIILLASWICMPIEWAYCATGDSQDRPRIGLALQGGGAKGFAHIGVLRWLEENRIPADMIAGTSMGGLIGGFYAMGMSPDEMEAFVGTLDWNELIGGEIPFKHLSVRRKEDRLAYPNRLNLGLRNGIQLPSGLNSGHGIGLILDRVTLPYYDLQSFDALPVPFRCVAVDLVTGKQKVFSEGPLQEALRATMSIPGVFSPVRQNEQIYIDGGVLNNLPVGLAKDFGTDAVIAVNLNVGPFDTEEADSLLGVIGRSVDVVIDDNVVRSMDMADLVVPVDVHGYSTLDFEYSGEIIRRGYESASAMSEELKKYALPEKEWKQYLVKREKLRKTDIPVPQFVEVAGLQPEPASLVRKDLDPLIGYPLDLDELMLRLNRIWGQGRYASISYRLVDRQGKAGLRIHPVEMEHSPPTLNIGMNVDGSDIGLIRFGLGARLTFFDLWGTRSEWRLGAGFGTQNWATTELYRPVTRHSNWFIAPRVYAENSTLDIYESGSRMADYRIYRVGFGIQGGYQFNQATELRLGQDLVWYEADLRTGPPQIEEYRHRVGVTSLQFRYLGQDDAIVPRKGIRIEAKGEWFSSLPYYDSGFPRAEMKLSYFQPVSRSGSLVFQGSGGTAFGREDLGLLSFSLGGIMRLGSFGRNELLGSQYYLATAGYLHEVASLPPLAGGEIYAASWYQIGRVYRNSDLPQYPMDISGGLFIKTLLGPVLLGGSYGSGGHRRLYAGIGAIF